MFSFYWNRNCVNVHWEIQSNKGWTFFCHVTLGPFLMGCLATYREKCFFPAFFSESSQRSGILNSWMWMATDAHTQAARIFPSGWDSHVTLTFEKWAKKIGLHLYCLTLLLCFLKKWILLPKKVIGNEKTHKELQKENHRGKDGL